MGRALASQFLKIIKIRQRKLLVIFKYSSPISPSYTTIVMSYIVIYFLKLDEQTSPIFDAAFNFNQINSL